MPNLEPCPLCGSQAKQSGDFGLFVECANRSCWLHFHPAPADQWNNRPGEAALTARIAEMADAARRYAAGEISAGKLGELLGLEPGELHAFKTACGAFIDRDEIATIGGLRARIAELEKERDRLREQRDMQAQLASRPAAEATVRELQRFHAALVEITKTRGPFSRDHQEHANNVIEAMAQVAQDALDGKDVEHD